MQKTSQPARQRYPLLKIVLFLALATTMALWFFRAPLQHRITQAGVLSNDSPPPELVEEIILKADDPRAMLLAAWHSGKIIHREAAIHTLPKVIPQGQPLPPDLDALLLSATLDPDLNVRETALGILRERKDTRLATVAAAQLHDSDQQVRLLGLNQFRFISPAIGVPILLPLLDDANPLVVTKTLNLLESWSGEKFAVKFTEVASSDEEKTGITHYKPGGLEKISPEVLRAKAWFALHQKEFPPNSLPMPDKLLIAGPPLPASDFELSTTDGKKVRLSDYRGKVVLINFWTTWCTACVGEMPRLIALQNKFQGKLIIIGVSLDLVPDDDEAPMSDAKRAAAAKLIREKIVRTIKERGLNYPILVDEKNEAGGCFNGGELPTTIIVDAQGNLRRRFIGTRSLPEFEAMLAEAGSNPPAE